MSTSILALAALVIAGVASYLLTPLSGRLATRLGVLDHPHEGPGYKRHAEAVPYMGGVAIFLGLSVGALLLIFVPGGLGSIPSGRYLLVLAIALSLGIVGLLDDIHSLPRTLRVAAQVGAALGAWALGFRVESLPIDSLNLAVTVLWIVGITNAFNLMDNMDGLLAGVAGVGALSFAIMGLLSGLPILPLISAAIAGAAFGFLAHNKHPARVFMGDAGSLFFGFVLSLLGMKLKFENLLQVTFLVPVIVLALPIFDTTLVVVSRLRNHRPVFLGGHDHASHRLVHMGFPVAVAVRILYLGAIALAWIGLVISRANVEVGWMLLAFVFAAGIYFGAVLLRVPVYDDNELRSLPADDGRTVGEVEAPARTLTGR